MKNIDKYKNDLNTLIEKGDKLNISMKYKLYPESIEKQIKEAIKDDEKAKEYIDNILPFDKEYQSWY